MRMILGVILCLMAVLKLGANCPYVEDTNLIGLSDSVYSKLAHHNNVIEWSNADGAGESADQYFVEKINRLLEKAQLSDTIYVWGDLRRCVYGVMEWLMGVHFLGFNCYNPAKISRHDVIGMALWYSQNIGKVDIEVLQFLDSLEIIFGVWTDEIKDHHLPAVSDEERLTILEQILDRLYTGFTPLPDWYKISTSN